MWNWLQKKLGITDIRNSISDLNALSNKISKDTKALTEVSTEVIGSYKLILINLKGFKNSLIDLKISINANQKDLTDKLKESHVNIKDSFSISSNYIMDELTSLEKIISTLNNNISTLQDSLDSNQEKNKLELNNIKTNMLESINSNLIIINDVAEELRSIEETLNNTHLTLNNSIKSNSLDLTHNIIESNKVLEDNLSTRIAEQINQISSIKEELVSLTNREDLRELNISINNKLSEIKDLANIPGPKGEDGKNGKDGLNGKDGKNGLNGKDGKDGKNGLTGKNGKDGLNGKNGKDGLNGKNGLTIIGPKGDKGKDGLSIQGPKGDKGDSIVGPPGKDGKPGKDGLLGKNGKDGLKCNNGEPGKNGKDGVTTTIIKTEPIPEQLIEKKIEEAISKIKLPTIEIPEDFIDKKIKAAIDAIEIPISISSPISTSNVISQIPYNLEVLDKNLIRAMLINKIPDVYNSSDINFLPATYEIEEKKIKLVGVGIKNGYCYNNSLNYSKQYDEYCYIGIIIKRDDIYKVMTKQKVNFKVYLHSWNLTKSGLIADYTLGEKAIKEYLYIGRYIHNTLSASDIERVLREETIIL